MTGKTRLQRRTVRAFASQLALFLMLQEASLAQSLFPRVEVYPTPQGTFGIAAGDFDGDGWLDLATTNSSTEHNGGLGLTTYLNQAGSGFAGRMDYATGHRPFGITSADLNEDGLADLAIATYYAEHVSLLYADENGDFSSASNYSVNGLPWDVVTGDFDRDGILDLASNHYDVTVMFGQPEGGIGNEQLVNTGTSGYGNLVAVDLNRDDYLDLAQTTGQGGQVQVLWGQSDGIFGPSETFDVGPDADALAVGDLNGDGLPDLAVTNWRLNRVSTFFGQATGGFEDPHYYFVEVIPRDLAIADLNADGRSDLAVTQTDNGQGFVSIFLGQENGLLALAESFPTYGNAEDLVIADFDQNGGLDLALTASVISESYNDFSVLYNRIPEPTTGRLLLVGIAVSTLVVRIRLA